MADMTPEQVKALSDFADKLVTGRRIACGFAHALVAVGTIAAAITGIVAAIKAALGHG